MNHYRSNAANYYGWIEARWVSMSDISVRSWSDFSKHNKQFPSMHYEQVFYVLQSSNFFFCSTQEKICKKNCAHFFCWMKKREKSDLNEWKNHTSLYVWKELWKIWNTHTHEWERKKNSVNSCVGWFFFLFQSVWARVVDSLKAAQNRANQKWMGGNGHFAFHILFHNTEMWIRSYPRLSGRQHIHSTLWSPPFVHLKTLPFECTWQPNEQSTCAASPDR